MAPVTKPSGARFEIEKFNWVGSLASENSVALAWQTAPTKTLQDLFQREFIVGGMSGVDPETTPLIYNALIGTKFKIVNGYNGTTDIALAMERREVDGIGDWSWSSLKMSKPGWLKDQRVHILLQGALTRNPELPNVPFALDYVKGDLDRLVFRLYFSQKEAARPVVAPPGIPPERLQALRAGFMQMALDSEFQNDAEKSKLLVDPAPGSSVQDIVSMIASAPGRWPSGFSISFRHLVDVLFRRRNRIDVFDEGVSTCQRMTFDGLASFYMPHFSRDTLTGFP